MSLLNHSYEILGKIRKSFPRFMNLLFINIILKALEVKRINPCLTTGMLSLTSFRVLKRLRAKALRTSSY
jgi:hypothetical protein